VTTPEIRLLGGESARAHVSALAEVLLDCVAGGASVGFMSSLTAASAREFFDSVGDEVAAGRRLLLAAFDGDELVGTVQVLLAMLPNALHRGEIAKLLVRRSARGRGVGGALMARAETEALAAGKTLLVLDAVTDGDAYRLYERLGWVRVGVVPGFALYPDGEPCSTTYFYKRLD
jgi:GNAT superfamily N-acetyltransferase